MSDVEKNRPEFNLSTTAILLFKAKAGSHSSRNALVDRCLPRLRRMAFGRLPRRLSGVADAEDIVQETLLRAFNRLERFEPRCEGAFLFYLRRILSNVCADYGRKVKRSVDPSPMEVEPAGRGPTPVEAAVGTEVWESYQAAVEKLSEGQREAVCLFVECNMDFDEIAEALQSPSANAARMVVARGLKRLAELMNVEP